MTETTNQIQIHDIFTLLNAVSEADKKGAYNALEMATIKPSFEKVHAFLTSYNKLAEEQSRAAAEASVIKPSETVTDAVPTVAVDPVEGVTTVSTKKVKKHKGV